MFPSIAAAAKDLKPNPDHIEPLLATHRACPPTVLSSYKSGKYTDLTISCGDLCFSVHQVIVCSMSDFFEKNMTFGKEEQEKHVELPEDDPEMIRRLIAYCYLSNYDPCSSVALSLFDSIKPYESTTSIAKESHAHYRHIQLFATTDPCACLMPNTQNLKQPEMLSKTKSASKFHKLSEKPVTGVEVANPLTIHATMYALADKYQVKGLGQLALQKFQASLQHHAKTSDFVNAVQIAYSSTPDSNRGLRDAVMQSFLVHFKVNIAFVPGLETKLGCMDELSFLLIKSWPEKSSSSSAR